LLMTTHYVAVNFSSAIWGRSLPYAFERELYCASLLYASFYSLVVYVIVAKGLQKPVKSANLALYTFIASQAGYVPLLVLIPGTIWPQSITYSFICSFVAGVWAFYVAEGYFAIPRLLESSSIEALKLLHESELRIMLQLSTLTATVVALVVLAVWLNILWPSIPEELRPYPASLLLQMLITLQALHVLVGLWFGYFGPVLDLLAKIRAAISERTKKMNEG